MAASLGPVWKADARDRRRPIGAGRRNQGAAEAVLLLRPGGCRERLANALPYPKSAGSPGDRRRPNTVYRLRGPSTGPPSPGVRARPESAPVGSAPEPADPRQVPAAHPVVEQATGKERPARAPSRNRPARPAAAHARVASRRQPRGGCPLRRREVVETSPSSPSARASRGPAAAPPDRHQRPATAELAPSGGPALSSGRPRRRSRGPG